MLAMNGRPARVVVLAALAVNDAQGQGEYDKVDGIEECRAAAVGHEGVVVVHISTVQEAEVIGDFAFFLVGGHGGDDIEDQ